MEKLLNNSSNHDDYQMEKWRRKYLKYKQKYLDLNKNLLNKRIENMSNIVNQKLKQIELNEKLDNLSNLIDQKLLE